MDEMSAEQRAQIVSAIEEKTAQLTAAVQQLRAENVEARAASGPWVPPPMYPAAAVVEFRPTDTGAVFVPAQTPVEPTNGSGFAWQTGAPVTVAPIRVVFADYVGHVPGLPDDPAPVHAVLRLRLVRIAEEWGADGAPDAVSLWFGAAAPETAIPLFDALHFRPGPAFARGEEKKWARVRAGVGGFGADEALFPVADEARLLVEAAAFDQKFFFLKLGGLAAVWGNGGALELAVTVCAPRGDVRARAADFRVNCVPVVNLERVQLSPVEFTPAARDRELSEPHILRVEGVAEMIAGTTEYGPAVRPGIGRGSGLGACGPEYFAWFRRRADGGHSPVISRRDAELNTDSPASVLTRVNVLRCDGPAASRWHRGAEALLRSAGGVLTGELVTPATGPIVLATLAPPPSPLSGLMDAERTDALRAFVRAAGVTPQAARWAAAITDVRVTVPEVCDLTLAPGEPFGPVNGRRVTVTLGDADELKAGLFAAALDRCLGLSTTRCEYTQLVLITPQEEFRCPPRLGSRTDL